MKQRFFTSTSYFCLTLALASGCQSQITNNKPPVPEQRVPAIITVPTVLDQDGRLTGTAQFESTALPAPKD